MKITKYAVTTGANDAFSIELERQAENMIMEEFGEALREAARHYVEKNMDKITAKLDMNGLANLIAIYASKKLAEDINKGPKDSR